MEVMYIKYANGQRYSIIKKGENIIMNNAKIIPFDSIRKIKNEHIAHSNNNQIKNTCPSDNKIDEKITNFFFDAIHKNYLSNKDK